MRILVDRREETLRANPWVASIGEQPDDRLLADNPKHKLRLNWLRDERTRLMGFRDFKWPRDEHLPGLMRACCMNVRDAMPRLVLADRLEECGLAERAEFIRAQVDGDDGRAGLLFREWGSAWAFADLSATTGWQWVGYERGLPRWAGFAADVLRETLAAIASYTTLDDLTATESQRRRLDNGFGTVAEWNVAAAGIARPVSIVRFGGRPAYYNATVGCVRNLGGEPVWNQDSDQSTTGLKYVVRRTLDGLRS